MRRGRIATWAVVIASIVLACSLLLAAVWSAYVVGQFDCPLGLEFERSSSEVVTTRYLPPRAECRYFYETPTGEELLPPSTVVHDASPALAVSALAFVLWAVALAFAHPIASRHASGDSPSEGARWRARGPERRRS